MRIRYKLILGSLVLALLASAVGFYATAVSRRALQASIEDTSSELAAELMKAVDRSIYTCVEEWRVFAASPLLQRTLEESNRQFAELPDVRAYMEDREQNWTAAPAGELTLAMKDLIAKDLSQELSQRLEALRQCEGHAVYREVLVTNRYGANVAQSAKTSDYRQDDEEWWQQTMRDGTYVGGLERDESVGTLSMAICVRVDAAGNPLGVIKAVLNFDSVASLLQAWESGSHSSAAEHSEDHQLFLLSADNTVLFNSHDPEIGLQQKAKYGRHACDFSPGETHTFLRDDEQHGQILAASAASDGFNEYQGQGWVLIVENGADQILAPVTTLRNRIALMSVGLGLSVFIVAVTFSLSLSRRITRLRRVAVELGEGNLEVRVRDGSSDEIADLAQSINQMAENQQEVARQANTIAEGDYGADIAVRSDKDELAGSINRMVASLRYVVRQANTIAEGDYSVDITPRSDQDELGVALNKMTRNLRIASAQNERERWLKTGQAELSNTVRGELDLPTLSRNVVTYLAKYLDAQVGVMYLSDDRGTLRLTGSYAFTQRKRLANEIKPGEGLVGQAALEKNSIVISEVPDDYVTVNSGLGEAVPRNLLATPMVLQGAVKGVLELGAFKPFTDTQIELLKLVSENIAIAVNSAQDRRKMGHLLEQSQRQSEELQSQQEELRAANEELEEQTQALKQSQETLQTQSEELQASNEELEEKSDYLSQQKAKIEKKNRALEIARRDVEEKAHDLEMASKYKSEFLANMSHELRTPLNSLLILAKSLAGNEEGNLTEEQVESAKVIHEGGQDLLRLINEILDLSKVEAGKLRVHLEEVDLGVVTSHLQTQFQPVADDQGIRFSCEIADDVPQTLKTDQQRLEQILKNLLSNALKFTLRGSVTFRVHRPSDDVRFHQSGLSVRNTVALSVIDTGIGIPEDRLNAIFEAFQQADGSTSRRFGGTGLGLAISREMTKLLGGEIQLRSQVDRGSTFSLYLPLVPEGTSAEEHPSQRAASLPRAVSNSPPEIAGADQPSAISFAAELPSDDDGQIGGNEKTVLIIEDDARFAKILADLSRKRGYRCLTAANGSSGLQLAFEHRPTGVILDLGLPDMTGFALLERLQSLHPDGLPPVIVYTGRHLTREEHTELRKYTGSIVLKGADSEERVLDEISLFLHSVESSLPADQQRVIRMLHDPDQIFKDRKVLLVDDDMRNTYALSKVLQRSGLSVVMADNGKLALEKIQTDNDIELVVMDIMMPVMDGCEAIRAIRAEQRFEKLPIIALTAKAMPEDRAKCLEAGANDYLTKPVDVEKLLSLMRVWLFQQEMISA